VYIAITITHKSKGKPVNQPELSGEHMQTIKDTIWRRRQLIFFILLIAMFPGIAFGHGIEMLALYVGQYGLIMEIITGVICCTFIHVSHWYAISRFFGLYLIIIAAVFLYSITEITSWLDIPKIVIMSLAVGFAFGLIPLYFGFFATCFVLKRIFKR